MTAVISVMTGYYLGVRSALDSDSPADQWVSDTGTFFTPGNLASLPFKTREHSEQQRDDSALYQQHDDGQSAPSDGPGKTGPEYREHVCQVSSDKKISTYTLLTCLKRSDVINTDINTVITTEPASFHLLATYLDRVTQRQAFLPELVNLLKLNGFQSVELILRYIEKEADVVRIRLASQVLKQLLRLLEKQRMTQEDTQQYIAFLNRLLWLTPHDAGINLWLAQLYHSLEAFDDARYHALIAVNSEEYHGPAAELLRTLDKADPAGPPAIDLEVTGNHYLVNASVNGYPVKLLLDTGASISGVTTQFSQLHGDILTDAEPIILNTAGGVVTAMQFTADQLSFGHLQFDKHPMVIFTETKFRDFDGLLGVDVLRGSNFYIDRKEAKLYILSASDSKTPGTTLP